MWLTSEMKRMRLGCRSTPPDGDQRWRRRSRACRGPAGRRGSRPRRCRATMSITMKRRHAAAAAAAAPASDHAAQQRPDGRACSAADVDGDAGRRQLALGARDQPGAGGVERGRGRPARSADLLAPGAARLAQLLVERVAAADGPGAGGGENGVVAPSRVSSQRPCRHCTRISTRRAYPGRWATRLCRASGEIARQGRTARDCRARERPAAARSPNAPARSQIKDHIRQIPGLPQAGHPVLRHLHPAGARRGLAARRCDRLAEAVRPHRPDLLVGIESRGFLVAAPLALKLDCGFIMVRKKGKLPGATIPYSYDLEYGTDTVEVQADAVCARPARGRARRPAGHRRHHAARRSRCCARSAPTCAPPPASSSSPSSTAAASSSVPFFSVVSYDS